MPRDREHWLPIEFGIVKAVQKMHPARARSAEADPQFARIFRGGAGHERRSLLMANLNELDLFLTLAQRFHNSVDAIARNPKNEFDSPLQERINQNVSASSSHNVQWQTNPGTSWKVKTPN